MIFHSLDFAIFFLLLTAAYWTLPRRGQNALLLAGSCVFYGWVHPWFRVLIAETTAVDYGAALGMDLQPTRRKAFLWLALGVNLGLSPFQSTVLGRQAGAYLFFIALLYSLPLWIQSLWAEAGGRDFVAAMTRDEQRPVGWAVAVQALLAGLLFAAILALHSRTTLDLIYFRF